MQAHGAEPEVALPALACLHNLGLEPDNRLALGEAGALATIRRTLVAHSTNGAVAHAALCALWSLHCAGTAAGLADVGPELQHVLAAHSAAPGVVGPALGLLRCLCTHRACGATLGPTVVALVRDALGCPGLLGHAAVVEAGLGCLWNLALLLLLPAAAPPFHSPPTREDPAGLALEDCGQWAPALVRAALERHPGCVGVVVAGLTTLCCLHTVVARARHGAQAWAVGVPLAIAALKAHPGAPEVLLPAVALLGRVTCQCGPDTLRCAVELGVVPALEAVLGGPVGAHPDLLGPGVRLLALLRGGPGELPPGVPVPAPTSEGE